MHRFHPLAGGWGTICERSGSAAVVGLSAFRRLEPLAGARAPGAHVVTYRCPLRCGEEHRLVLTQDELDWLPLTTRFPLHHDLMTSRPGPEADGGIDLWWRSMRRGHWPVTLHCPRHEEPVGAWPSCLRVLEPDREPRPVRLLVHWTCPACEHDGCQEMAAAQLALVAR